tara:strand:+ start:932 stop:1897 length:966 start_codon:yes stop_codon:yes gene_type:complete
MKVLLIVPVHNRLEDVKLLLLSLLNLEVNNIALCIAIVDDASDYPVQPAIEKKFSQFKLYYFRNNTPKGPGFSRNLAARAIASDFIWFLDSDTEIFNPQVLDYMLQKFDSDRSIGAIGGDMEKINDKKWVMEAVLHINYLGFFKSFPLQEYQPSYVKLIPTSNLLVRREMFELAEGFLEDLLRDEDKDFCITIRRLGYNCYQDSETVVWHKLSSAGRNSGFFAHFADPIQYMRDYLKTRTRLLARHVHWRLLILPILDMVIVPIELYRIKIGLYPNSRLNKVANISSRKKYILFFNEYIKCYLWGVRFFFRQISLLTKKKQ